MWLGMTFPFFNPKLTLGIGGWAQVADVRLTFRGPRWRTSYGKGGVWQTLCSLFWRV